MRVPSSDEVVLVLVCDECAPRLRLACCLVHVVRRCGHKPPSR